MLSEKEPIIRNHTVFYFRLSVYKGRFDEKRHLVFLDLIKKDICRVESNNINNRHRDEVIQLVHLILLLVKNWKDVQIFRNMYILVIFPFGWILYNAESWSIYFVSAWTCAWVERLFLLIYLLNATWSKKALSICSCSGQLFPFHVGPEAVLEVGLCSNNISPLKTKYWP